MKLCRQQLNIQSRIPLYLQLSAVLREYIADVEGLAAGVLPGEIELCSIFQVSRSTVAKAVAILAQENLVKRIKRQGTVILAAQTHYNPLCAKKSLGLVFPVSSNWNFALEAIHRESCIHGYNLESYSYTWDSLEEETAAIEAARGRCAGIILYPNAHGNDPSLVRKLNEDGIPLVLFDVDFTEVDCNAVLSDGESAGYRLGDYLLEQGCGKILCCSCYSHLRSVRKKLDGFHAALRRAGKQAFEYLEVPEGDLSERTKVKLLQEKLSHSPDGIFCTFKWDEMFDELTASGYWNVKVANCDIAPLRKLNFDVFSAETSKLELATVAVRLLCERIQKKFRPFEKRLFSCRFLLQNKGGIIKL